MLSNLVLPPLKVLDEDLCERWIYVEGELDLPGGDTVFPLSQNTHYVKNF